MSMRNTDLDNVLFQVELRPLFFEVTDAPEGGFTAGAGRLELH
jgi:hypothetical protein